MTPQTGEAVRCDVSMNGSVLSGAALPAFAAPDTFEPIGFRGLAVLAVTCEMPQHA
jgi:hypothetical protein